MRQEAFGHNHPNLGTPIKYQRILRRQCAVTYLQYDRPIIACKPRLVPTIKTQINIVRAYLPKDEWIVIDAVGVISSRHCWVVVINVI